MQIKKILSEYRALTQAFRLSAEVADDCAVLQYISERSRFIAAADDCQLSATPDSSILSLAAAISADELEICRIAARRMAAMAGQQQGQSPLAALRGYSQQFDIDKSSLSTDA